MRLKSMILIAVAATGFLPAAGTAAVRAQSQVTIATGDLNLSSAAGRATLQARIEGAAQRLCSQHVGQSLAETQFRRACRIETVAGARDQLAARIVGIASHAR